MKAVITLLFILIFGAIALANAENHVKVNDIEMGFVLGSGLDCASATSQIEFDTENGLARLYKFKNSRVRKALTFSTKHSQSKLV